MAATKLFGNSLATSWKISVKTLEYKVNQLFKTHDKIFLATFFDNFRHLIRKCSVKVLKNLTEKLSLKHFAKMSGTFSNQCEC